MYLKFEHKAAPQPYLQWHIQHKRHTSQIIPFPLPDPHLWQFKLWSVDDENFDRLKIPATLNCLGFLESLPNAKSPSESSGWGLQKKQKTVSWSDDLQFLEFYVSKSISFSWPPQKSCSAQTPCTVVAIVVIDHNQSEWGTGVESPVQTELCSQPWIDCTLKQILPVAVMLTGHLLHGN